jgi:hypothetical protein
MSRSNQPLKELFTGLHLVIIAEAKMQEKLLVRFSDGNNKHFDKFYDFDSEFIKMCGDAGTITEASVFDDKTAIGKRLWIAIKEVWSDTETVNFYIFDTFPYVDGMPAPKVAKSLFSENQPPIIFKEGKLTVPSGTLAEQLLTANLPDKKAKIIAEQRAMMQKVISKPTEDLDIM